MARTTREFTIAELRALDLPPDDPDSWPEHLLADEYEGVVRYSARRRLIFNHEDQTWAVDYETDIDSGDYEANLSGPPDYGWWDTVVATAVEPREVTVTKWVEIDT